MTEDPDDPATDDASAADSAADAGSFMEPEFHLAVLDDLVYEADVGGAVPLASYPDNRYPYVYPRDVASITRAWLATMRADIRPERCRDDVRRAAQFLLRVQDGVGRWRQRYTLDGTDAGIYVQEDNVAHGMRVLAHAMLAAADGAGTVDESFLDDAVTGIDDAVEHARTTLFDPNAHLIESTTSIHEGRIESGYTLWVNCAFLAALRQARRAFGVVPASTDEVDGRVADLLATLEGGVERAFTCHADIPRRYAPEGTIDRRPDVTLFAPYYFGLEDVFGDALDAAAERAATALEDPRLGGLQRFMGFHRDFDIHQHGGTGPWMQYTAWHAQYRFDRGKNEKGEAVLSPIKAHADENGHIPEHLTTRARYRSFVENEWDTGRDFAKEFDDAVLRDVPFDRVVEEAGHMRDAYQRLASRTRKRDVVGFAAPLAWSHAEVLSALLRRDGD